MHAHNYEPRHTYHLMTRLKITLSHTLGHSHAFTSTQVNILTKWWKFIIAKSTLHMWSYGVYIIIRTPKLNHSNMHVYMFLNPKNHFSCLTYFSYFKHSIQFSIKFCIFNILLVLWNIYICLQHLHNASTK